MLRILLVGLLTVTIQWKDQDLRALQSRLVSPDVVASWSFNAGNAGGDVLRFLVLWRGTPGWQARAGSFATQGLSATSFEFAQQIMVGPHTLMIAEDLRKASALIDRREVDLRRSNVFLVDGVDQTLTPRAHDAHWVEPEVSSEAGIEGIIRREPMPMQFLRCEAVAKADVVGKTVCERTLGI